MAEKASKKEYIRNARTCYDHLAGKMGVKLTQTLVDMGVMTKEQDQFQLTRKGEQFLTDFGLDLPALRQKKRSFSRCCLDGTEKIHHLGGSLGFGLLEQLFKRKWIEKVSGTRAIKITEAGKRGFKERFRIKDFELLS